MRQRRNNAQRFCRRIKDGRQARLVFLALFFGHDPGSSSTRYLLTAPMSDHADSSARENW